MIRVERADQPATFDDDVRQPGLLALRELVGDPTVPRRRGPKRKHLPTLWTRALPDMRISYRRTCAYLAMHIHRGTGRDTVDHFVARDIDRSLAYEWRNFRYASLDVNRLKDVKPVLDPFEVEDGWFGLNLATFEVEARVPRAEAETVPWKNTLEILNEPTFRDARRWYHERYFGRKLDDFDPDEPMPLGTLRAEAPFVARELRRQHRLRREDMLKEADRLESLILSGEATTAQEKEYRLLIVHLPPSDDIRRTLQARGLKPDLD